MVSGGVWRSCHIAPKFMQNGRLLASIWSSAIVGSLVQGHDTPNHAPRRKMAQAEWGACDVVSGIEGCSAGVRRRRRIDRCDGRRERWRLRHSRAERLRAGIVLCRHRCWRSAVVDVLESGDHDAGAGHSERVRGELPYCRPPRTARPAATCLVCFAGTGNIADNALVPGSYFSWQLNPRSLAWPVGQRAIRLVGELPERLGRPRLWGRR